MSREPDWNEMASAWQAQPAPSVDVHALRREAARRGRRLRWTVVSEVLLTALMVLLFAWVIATQQTTGAEKLMFGGLAAVIVLYQAYMVWLRRREWSETGLDAPALLALEIRRCDTVAFYWRFGMWSVLVLWLGLYVAWLWAMSQPAPGLSPEGLMGGLLVNVAIIPLMGLYGVWRSHQARRRRARLQTLRAELAGKPL